MMKNRLTDPSDACRFYYFDMSQVPSSPSCCLIILSESPLRNSWKQHNQKEDPRLVVTPKWGQKKDLLQSPALSGRWATCNQQPAHWHCRNLLPKCLEQVALGVKNLPSNAGSIPGSGRHPGGRHGNPLQYSYLENPKDRGIGKATVHWVTKS